MCRQTSTEILASLVHSGFKISISASLFHPGLRRRRKRVCRAQALRLLVRQGLCRVIPFGGGALRRGCHVHAHRHFWFTAALGPVWVEGSTDGHVRRVVVLTPAAGTQCENLVWRRGANELVSYPFSGKVSFQLDNRHVAKRCSRPGWEEGGHPNVPIRQVMTRGFVPTEEGRFPPIAPTRACLENTQ